MRGSWWLSCFTTFTRTGLARKQRRRYRQACWIVQEHTTGSQEQETETFWEAAGDFSVEPNTGSIGGLFWDCALHLPVVGKSCLMQGTPCPDKATDLPRKARSARASATGPPGAVWWLCGAHRQRRGALLSTLRQQGGEGREARTGRPPGSWAQRPAGGALLSASVKCLLEFLSVRDRS